MQEVITLAVFAVCRYLGKGITWNYVIGFTLIAAGAFFVFAARSDNRRRSVAPT